MEIKEGIVTHIQRMSLHDGPGIRTTLFFKGCNLRCKWCHNPETFLISPEFEWIKSKCVNCGICIEKCSVLALSYKHANIYRNKDLCIHCKGCVSECYWGAHRIIGENYTVSQLCERVESDRCIYTNSGGGVTISGGEPMIQYPFLIELLKALSKLNIHVVLQTNMNVKWELYESILPYVNYFMCDLKHSDSLTHSYWTGKGNELILCNIRKLDGVNRPYSVRTPVIPGVNDKKEQLTDIHRFVSGLKNIRSYELVPFHPFAENKYRNLGLDYDFEYVKPILGEAFKKMKMEYEIYR